MSSFFTKTIRFPPSPIFTQGRSRRSTPCAPPRAQSDPTSATSTPTTTEGDGSLTDRGEIKMEASLVRSIRDVGAEAWDACHDGSNPFLSYAYLEALEESGSIAGERGWLPQHFIITDASSSPPQVLACCPLYLKSHSYGEYVFDNAWSQSYDLHFGRPGSKGYYPKLQSCVPFTPVTGSRILVRPGDHSEQVSAAVANTLASLPRELGFSSLHCTFNTASEWKLMAQAGAALQRIGVQYHFFNDASPRHDGSGSTMYESFADFEAGLQQKRRKAVRQERKKVAAAGLTVKRLTGADVQDPALWDAFYEFYLNTIDRKWGSAYLTREFFEIVSTEMADKILLVVAEESSSSNSNTSTGLLSFPVIGGARERGGKRAQPIAAALNFLGDDAIYGRNWGCIAGDEIKGLHFELCYYQAIEHAIENKLARVEAGAQGEHKIARGYLPVRTHSSHYIPNEEFREAVDAFLRQERGEIEYYIAGMTAQESPYKKV